uniref:Putative secreted peptide n=1 Tax=Anopheles braziliensis TaxID=58242 RepID=A0A2M3ZTN8_9DIPT
MIGLALLVLYGQSMLWMLLPLVVPLGPIITLMPPVEPPPAPALMHVGGSCCDELRPLKQLQEELSEMLEPRLSPSSSMPSSMLSLSVRMTPMLLLPLLFLLL